MNLKTTATDDGPQIRITLHCAGCRHLKTMDCVEEHEDDVIDEHTRATCAVADREISGWWSRHDVAPAWCPKAPPDLVGHAATV